MCTVVVHCSCAAPVLLLALRDERVGRSFDDPGAWWPELPHVVGGRDRVAGGTWCATDTTSGATAFVLNGPQKPTGDPGAASRGVLPLLALEHGGGWPGRTRVDGMASFDLGLASPDGLDRWTWDGERLTATRLGTGTHMLTAGAREQGRRGRHLSSFTAAVTAAAWRAVVQDSVPSDDPDALLVRYPHAGATFATVFAQVVEAEPGRVDVQHSHVPSDPRSWVRSAW